MKKKTMMIAGMTMAAVGVMTGCSGSTKTTDTKAETTAETKAETTKAAEKLSGSISMSGSTSMEKFANALCESFMEKYPDVNVTVEFTGSSAGVESVLSGK